MYKDRRTNQKLQKLIRRTFSTQVEQCPLNATKTDSQSGQLSHQNLSRKEVWDRAKPFEDIPGPKSFPVVGGLYNYMPLIGKL